MFQQLIIPEIKHITPKVVVWINDFIIGWNDDNNHGSGINIENANPGQEVEKQGTLILIILM